MVEMHRSQEVSRPQVSPIKKHSTASDRHHSKSASHSHNAHGHSHSPHNKKKSRPSLQQSVSFEEEDEYDDDYYSNDDFEEESVLNSSRFSQSPTKQV